MNAEHATNRIQAAQPIEEATPPTRQERVIAAYKWSCHFHDLIDRSFGRDVDSLLCRHLLHDMAEWKTPAEYESIEKDVGRYTKTLPFIERENVLQKTFFNQFKLRLPRHPEDVVSRADCAAIFAEFHAGFITPDWQQESVRNCARDIDVPF